MAYYSAQDLSLEAEDIGVAITHGALGAHLGLIYPTEDGSAKLLHLGWHKHLVVDDYPQQNWLATIVRIPPIASAQAVALIRGMADRYGNANRPDGLDYGINLFAGQGAIKGDGSYSPTASCDGFTCASIIAEILRQIGFQLVALNTWVAAPKNEAWGRAIVCMLKATRTPDAHVAKVESNINGLRLRPEEVAAAAELPIASRPAIHQVLQMRSEEILSQVFESCGPPPVASSVIQPCLTSYQAELAQL